MLLLYLSRKMGDNSFYKFLLDKLFWKLDARGRFSVCSLSRSMKRSQYYFLWRVKILLLIKAYMVGR